MAFSIVDEYTKTNQRYKLKQHIVEIILNPLKREVVNPEKWLQDGLQGVFNYIVENVNPEDKVGMTFTADEFNGDFHIPFKQVVNLRFEELWKRLHILYQSNKAGVQGDTFKIITTSFTPYKGSGRNTQVSLTFAENCAKRKGIVNINNKDNLCLVRALVVAMAYLQNVPYLKQLRQNIGKRQDEEVQKLIQASGITVPLEGAGVEELQLFQRYLKEYKIVVYSYGTKGRDVLFEGPDNPLRINLIHHNNHYNVITSLTSAFCCGYYCQDCNVPYDHKEKHRCRAQCPCCTRQPPCPKIGNEISCEHCSRRFRGQQCYDNHKVSGKNGKSLCDNVKRCEECLKSIKAGRQHYCGEFFCKVCKKHMPSNHLCYIQKDTGKPKLDDTLFVFYDLETRQDQVNALGENVHAPVLCVFQQRCSECFSSYGDNECEKCGIRQHILQGENAVELFFNYLWSLKIFKSIVVVAHNGGSFDHHFIFRHVLEKTDLKPEIIKRGSKLLMLTAGKLKFIDSINYFPMKLSALPKAFDLKELKKGYFPHLFNTKANEDYAGTIPDAKYYSPDTMKPADRSEFMEWYEQQKGKYFDMSREIVNYCVSDVDILTNACIKFHKIMMEQGNVSPFTEAITIPGACNKLFRRGFLKPNTIGVLPKNGFRNADTQSKIALQWLIYEEEQRGLVIRHAGRQREVNIYGVKVDGFCDGQVFEFHGCYFHGCPTCFPVNREKPSHEDPTDTMEARYERTTKKTERLRQKGIEVVEIWEHEFRQLLDNDKNLKDRLDNHPMLRSLPLNPRDAFYGGRTGCTKSHYCVKEGEKIKYVDVCSLYPWVCKYGKFPVGHPKVLIGEEPKEGLIKCKILPPTDLYHPVLPMKANDKLMFALCHTCTMELNQSDCNHTDDERALTGTWVIDEVRKAVECGYKVIEVYEGWEYDTTQHDGNSGGLFTEFMDKFINIKQQASGWPAECITEEQKNAYVADFMKSEGIQMEQGEIVKNAGLRSLAKLILNSFWGKLGQRENQPRCVIVRQPQELYDLVSNPAIDVTHMSIINETVLLVSYTLKDEAADIIPSVNVAIAAYVTAQARLKLYSYLERLGERVLYYDTDSVIYVSRTGEWDVPTGSSLGEMTDELEEYGQGGYIEEFTSAGPKNYSFRVVCPTTGYRKEICKVKGFNLNYRTSQLINPHSMKKMVCGPSEPILIENDQIRRTNTHEVVTKTEKKVYRHCLEKRKFTTDHDSTPYGYKKPRN